MSGELIVGDNGIEADLGVIARICAQPNCGFVLGPQNKSGYCAKHGKPSDRAERRFCAEPGCGQRLRSDNTTKFCFVHRCQKLRSTAKSCKECGKKLNAQNGSGYCTNHHSLASPAHARAIAKRAAQPTCAERGCLQPANKNGFCGAHRFAKNRPSVMPQPCKVLDCGALLKSNNKSGYCQRHSHKAHPIPRRKCEAEEGCQVLLGNNNKSGFCLMHKARLYQSEHLETQRKRTAEWRARQQQNITDLVAEVDAARARLAEREAALEKAKALPSDLERKSPLFQVIFIALRSKADHMSNRDLVDMLFRKKEHRELLARASYGKDVPRVLENRIFQNLVTDVRRLADRPGEKRRTRG
jgi:hypothetical protein